MAWDPTPWFVGGGAQHSPEIARLLAYAATSGSEGIVTGPDLQVRALSVPGSSVRVAPGACVVRNRSTGGTLQTYVGRLPVEDTVSIASTGSAAGRTDLVIARVEDPFMAGTPWQDPADPTKGPYIFTRVLSNVPASAIVSSDAARRYIQGLGYSAIPLAGITIPKSTATITQTMIKSLREMANPRRKRDLSTYALVAANAETQTVMTAGGEFWPNAAVNNWDNMEIPEWATTARVVATWAQVLIPPGNSYGTLWVQLGPAGGPYTQNTQTVSYDTPNLTNNSRSTFVLGDRINIPVQFRGTAQSFRMRAQLTYKSSDAARIRLDGGSAVVLDLEFLEAPSEDDF